MFPKIGVPQIIHFNRVFLINHPFWGTFIFGNTHMMKRGFSIPRKMSIPKPIKSESLLYIHHPHHPPHAKPITPHTNHGNLCTPRACLSSDRVLSDGVSNKTCVSGVSTSSHQATFWIHEKTLTATLLGTNISPPKGILKMVFLFPRWDMLVPCMVSGFRTGKSDYVHSCSLHGAWNSVPSWSSTTTLSW